MGQATEDMLAGLVCQECGEWMDDIIDGAEEPGYPRTCAHCGGDEDTLPPRKPSRDPGRRSGRAVLSRARAAIAKAAP